jgi:hypothetical protein
LHGERRDRRHREAGADRVIVMPFDAQGGEGADSLSLLAPLR